MNLTMNMLFFWLLTYCGVEQKISQENFQDISGKWVAYESVNDEEVNSSPVFSVSFDYYNGINFAGSTWNYFSFYEESIGKESPKSKWSIQNNSISFYAADSTLSWSAEVIKMTTKELWLKQKETTIKFKKI